MKKYIMNSKTLVFLIGFLTSSMSLFAQMEMIHVEGGKFMMGCTPEQGTDCYSTEDPAHAVKVSDFYICKYEVTQKDWKTIMGDNPSYHENCDSCPVEKINWYSMIVYCNELTLDSMSGADRVYYKDAGFTDPWDINDYNGAGDTDKADVYWDQSKNGYRLPTEAEWEFAARGGVNVTPTKYAGGNTLIQVGWYFGNSGNMSHKIGDRPGNELDIHDMSGNVWEAVWDIWGNYEPQHQCDPKGPVEGSSRSRRGGAFNSDKKYCRVSRRNINFPTIRSSSVGMRLAKNSN